MLTSLALIATASVTGPPQVARLLTGVPVVEPHSISSLERRAIANHRQLQLHQEFAVATLGLMALNSGLGVYDVYFSSPGQLAALHTVHVALGGATTALYLSAATLALTTTGGYQVTGEPTWDSVAVHEDLAWLHAGALLATVILGGLTAMGQLDPLYHGIAGGVTVVLMTASVGVIVFDF